MSGVDPERAEELRRESDRLLAQANVPEEGTVDDGFRTMHEMYESAKRGGFTRYEALWIVACVLGSGFMKGEESP